MVADSFTDSELLHGSPISRDLPKKRKGNWFWKLKQWKIDPRRRQWISQWKRDNLGEEENGCRLKSLRDKLTDRKTGSETVSNFQALKVVDHEEGCYDGFTKCHDCDDDDDDETNLDRTSSASSPTSVLKNKDSNSNKSWDDCFCCSKPITEEDEAFDDAFDNWDDFSDALNSFEAENDESPLHEAATELEKGADPNPNTSQRKNKSSPKNLFHEEDKCKQATATSPGKAIHEKNKKKKKSEKQESDKGKDCPICSEKMDATDLSFLPCPCGFRLCLFCHKQINENDQRCPQCRKKYVDTRNNNGEVGFLQRGNGKLRLSPSFRGLDRA